MGEVGSISTDGPSEPAPGLTLLLDRLWNQEVAHKLILAELLRETDLGRRLGVWNAGHRPGVLVEPGRGIVDLALAQGTQIRVAIELKFAAASGHDQRARQQAWADGVGASRCYILLGTSFFEVPRDEGVRYVGVPELLGALRDVQVAGGVGELLAAYAARLERDSAAWTETRGTAGAIATLRLYQEIADAWPVDVRPHHATNRSGPDWLLNGDAWTRVDIPGWEPAQLYWEIAGGTLRFKIMWTGDRAAGMVARRIYERALLDAGREVQVDVVRSARRPGRYMTAAAIPGGVVDQVVVDGIVSPERSRRLYDDATRVFRGALSRLEPLNNVGGDRSA